MAHQDVKEWILETIDQLRKRKARPDLERICHMLERRHRVAASQTEACLEKLVDAEIVMKVDYKGNTSYRNSAKWRRSHLGGVVLNSTSASRKLVEAVQSLTAQTQTHAEEAGQGQGEGEGEEEGEEAGAREGASARDIERWMETHAAEIMPLKSPINIVLQREVDAGRLDKLASGNFLVCTRAPGETDSSLDSMTGAEEGAGSSSPLGMPVKSEPSSPSTPAPCQSPIPQGLTPLNALPPTPKGSSGRPRLQSAVPAKRGRPPKRKDKIYRRSKSLQPLKKLKRSDSESLEARPLPVAAPPRCDFCRNTEESNSLGRYEALLFCKDCVAKAHPSCMDYGEELARRARLQPWQCIDCKTCFICEDAGDPDQMLFCDGCDRGFHMNCHEPKVTEKPLGKWVCQGCVEDGVTVEKLELEGKLLKAEKDEVCPDLKPHILPVDKAPSFLQTPCASPVAGEEVHNHNGPTENGRTEPEPSRRTASSRMFLLNGGKYPDASEWTIEDVVAFFRAAGFEDQCEAFREQEIDGKSLLLMRRIDVLTGLSVKLGPALKMYCHVRGLQMACQQSSL